MTNWIVEVKGTTYPNYNKFLKKELNVMMKEIKILVRADTAQEAYCKVDNYVKQFSSNYIIYKIIAEGHEE